MIGPAIIITLNHIEISVPGEGANLAIIATEHVERGRYRAVSQAVRTGFHARALAELVANEVKDASSGNPVIRLAGREADKQRFLRLIGAAQCDPRRESIADFRRKREQ